MNLEMVEKPDDLAMRRRIETIRQQSQDWEYQQRMAVESFQEQEHERALQAVAVSLYQSPAFQRLLTVERNKQRSYAVPRQSASFRGQPDMITRSAPGAYTPSHGGRVSLPGVHPRPTLAGRRACGCWLCVK